MYIFSLTWRWVSKLLSRSAGVESRLFLGNPFFKSSSPTPPLYFLTTPLISSGQISHAAPLAVATPTKHTKGTSCNLLKGHCHGDFSATFEMRH